MAPSSKFAPSIVGAALVTTVGLVGCFSKTQSLNTSPITNGGEQSVDVSTNGTGGHPGGRAGASGRANAATSGKGSSAPDVGGSSSGGIAGLSDPNAGSQQGGSGMAGAPNRGGMDGGDRPPRGGRGA